MPLRPTPPPRPPPSVAPVTGGLLLGPFNDLDPIAFVPANYGSWTSHSTLWTLVHALARQGVTASQG